MFDTCSPSTLTSCNHMKFKRRNPLMLTQSEIARLTGTTQSHISEIINGWRDGKPAPNRKKPSPEMCEALEEATSVCRESWIWPDRHWNPYIPLDHNGPTMCTGCQHRDAIVQLKANLIARWVLENIETLAPKEILYRMISDLWVGFGSSEWINFAWYHLGATKLRLIVDKGGYEMFKDVKAEHMPWCHSEIRRQGWFFFDKKIHCPEMHPTGSSLPSLISSQCIQSTERDCVTPCPPEINLLNLIIHPLRVSDCSLKGSWQNGGIWE